MNQHASACRLTFDRAQCILSRDEMTLPITWWRYRERDSAYGSPQRERHAQAPPQPSGRELPEGDLHAAVFPPTGVDIAPGRAYRRQAGVGDRYAQDAGGDESGQLHALSWR